MGALPARGGLLLAFAVVAIAFAAADTYVVVLALPEMMTTAGIDLDQLHDVVGDELLGADRERSGERLAARLAEHADVGLALSADRATHQARSS